MRVPYTVLALLAVAAQKADMKLHLLPFAATAFFALSSVSAKAEADLSSLYGDYLSASYANEIEDMRSRQKYYAKAFEAVPDDIRLGRRAIVSAIETGDMDSAVDLAEQVYKKDKTEAMARTVLGVNAFRKNRNKRALKYFSGPSDDLTMTIMMQLIRGWIEVERGELDDARARFESIGGAEYFNAFGKLQNAKIDILEEKYDAAAIKLDEVEATGISGVEIALTRTRMLALQGQTVDALQNLTELLDDNEGLTIGPVGEYRDALEAGRDLPKISIKGQAARAVTDPSWAFFARNRSMDGAELYLRFARWIDPSYQKSAIWLGSMLEEKGEVGQMDAYDLYRAIPDSNPYYVSSQLNIANIYFVQEKDDEALRVLEDLNDREGSLLTRESLGRARFFRENYEEALPFYTRIVDSMTDEEITANVEPLRFRGIIYERLNRWPEAEADFKRVLEYQPDDVDTLNYLGYTWVDRGENLVEAFEMIEKALAQEPNSGAITDSLGWAHYKLGDYEEAKIHLEDAVALDPSSATIIDHLGDVYWKLGRKREAGYQWKRALLFEPTDKEKANIALKLEGGLEAVPVTTQALP